jgi:hypothetical protein
MTRWKSGCMGTLGSYCITGNCLLLERLLQFWFTSYRLGYELLILNGLLTFAGCIFCA